MSDEPAVVLLVDDNPTDAELAIRVMRRAGMLGEIRWVRDGAEALDVFYTSAGVREHLVLPRLVLLDIKMPKVDGLEVLRRLKGHEGTRDVPVVMLTSSHEQRDLDESYRLGANAFVVKPVEYDRFATTIAATVEFWVHVNRVPS